jgi:hypothetical protein
MAERCPRIALIGAWENEWGARKRPFAIVSFESVAVTQSPRSPSKVGVGYERVFIR